MRFKLHLRKTSQSSLLPINYQYKFSSWIYKVLLQSDVGFTNQLHNEGPVFTREMIYRAMLPVVVSLNRKHENRPALYLEPEHKDFLRIFIDNHVHKWGASDAEPIAVYEGDRNGAEEVMRMEVISKAHSKPIDIRSHSRVPVKVKGYLFDFRLTAPHFIHETGYTGGFGAKNSVGFGFAEVSTGSLTSADIK